MDTTLYHVQQLSGFVIIGIIILSVVLNHFAHIGGHK